MDRQDETIPREQIEKWIRSDEFRRQVLPRLVAWARRVHRGFGRYKKTPLRDRAVEVEDLVQEATARLLSGKRKCGVNEDPETVLYGVIDSLASHGDERVVWLDAEGYEDHESTPAPSWHPVELIAAKTMVERLEKAVVGDRGVEQLYEAITEKDALTPKEQGAALGWLPNVVRATFQRLKRRAAAAGIKLEEGDDDDGHPNDRSPTEAGPPRRGGRNRGAG
jgi:hypothetical protein